MILAIDIGNTRIKSGVFENNAIIKFILISEINFIENIIDLIKDHPAIDNLIVSSVGKIKESDFLQLKNRVDILFIDQQSQFPFENLYQTPLTLGIDRLVLAAGAVLKYPACNRLVIDAGTCVTYDFINNQNQYLGGAISPGLRLRYESLNNYTAKLPLLTLESPDNPIGNSTAQSIHSGVVNGLTNEISGFVNQFEKENSNFIIILTGGDADFLAKRLKNTIFANSNFLLESLNLLYHYKNQNV